MQQRDLDPEYPSLGATVAKHRRPAHAGLCHLTREQRHAYGEAVLDAIRALQAGALRRKTPTHNVYCASGTNHNTGKAIIKAIRQRHRSHLISQCDAIRRARTPSEWEEMYEAAMKEKAARAATPVAKEKPITPPPINVVKYGPVIEGDAILFSFDAATSREAREIFSAMRKRGELKGHTVKSLRRIRPDDHGVGGGSIPHKGKETTECRNQPNESDGKTTTSPSPSTSNISCQSKPAAKKRPKSSPRSSSPNRSTSIHISSPCETAR